MIPSGLAEKPGMEQDRFEMQNSDRLYEGYAFDLKQMSQNARENPEHYKDFFEKALTLLPRRILIYLDRQGFLFAEGADGTLFPTVCVTVRHYPKLSPPIRLEVDSGGRVLSTFTLGANWEDIDVLENRYNDSFFPLDYFDEAVKSYLEDDPMLRLVDCYDRSLARTDADCFSPQKHVLRMADFPDDAFTLSELGYRKQPDRLPGYRSFKGEKKVRKADSYLRFFRAASCMGTDGEEEVFRKWEASDAARVWNERHMGRSFSHIVIPVKDVLGELLADIELFALFPPEDAEPRFAEVLKALIRESRLCVREVQQYRTADAFRESTYKYALSSIMTRNMSHNIGSHVYMHLTDPKEGTFSAVEDGGPYFGLVGNTGDVKTDHLHQIAYLNSYIRNRMDFISDVSSRRPSSLSTWNIRGDLMKAFDRTRLLLNHISGLEAQFRYKIDVQNNVAKVVERNYEGKPAKDLEKARLRVLHSDLEVAIPNNIIGWHALYNIIENVIRNVAKHGGSALKENVFTLSFSDTDLDPGLYEVLLFHNLSFTAEEAGRMVSVINAKLEAPVLVGAELRAGDLGIVEMEASAAVLRQLEGLSAVSHDNGVEPPLLEAVLVPCGEEGKTFWGYRFYMLRPHDCLRVVPDGGTSGWNVMTAGELESFLSGGGAVSHDFLVYDDVLEDTVKGLRLRYRTALPVRVFRAGFLEKVGESEKVGVLAADRAGCWTVWEHLHGEDWRTWEIQGDLVDKGSPSWPSRTAVMLSHNADGNGTQLDLGEVVDRWCGKEEHIYLEALSSAGQAFLPRFQEARGQMSEYIGKMLDDPLSLRWRGAHAELMEAITTRVFVLDERIQAEAWRQSYMKAPLWGLLELSGVRMPDPNLESGKYNLQEQIFNEDKCRELLSLIGKELVRNDFMVLHYGLLERIFKNLETPGADWLSLMHEQLEGWLTQGDAGEIVVTSGRGVPKNLPDEVRFISSSAVFSAAVEVRSKFMLDKILHGSRKINNT